MAGTPTEQAMKQQPLPHSEVTSLNTKPVPMPATRPTLGFSEATALDIKPVPTSTAQRTLGFSGMITTYDSALEDLRRKSRANYKELDDARFEARKGRKRGRDTEHFEEIAKDVSKKLTLDGIYAIKGRADEKRLKFEQRSEEQQGIRGQKRRRQGNDYQAIAGKQGKLCSCNMCLSWNKENGQSRILFSEGSKKPFEAREVPLNLSWEEEKKR